MIVLVGGERLQIDVMFVGDKIKTLKSLKTLLVRKDMWIDFIEKALSIITVHLSQTNNE